MKKNKRIALMLSGVLFMGAALGLAGYNLYEDSLAAESASSVLQQLKAGLDTQPTGLEGLPTGITGEIVEEETIDPDTPMPTITIDGTAYIGSVVIPALGVELPVAADWSYPQMKISPCRYEGSVYKNDLVICAHNYSTHFRNIKDLQKGDAVIFVDVVGNEYAYHVEAVEDLKPTAVSEMISSAYDLSLFTCNYAGNARVTVRCEREEE